MSESTDTTLEGVAASRGVGSIAVDAFFAALDVAAGDTAASLFTEDAVLDAGSGGRHAGRDAIRVYVDERQPLDVEMVTVLSEGARTTAYGIVHVHGDDSMPMRWVFHFEDRQVTHLDVSRINSIPAFD